tara:strand:- start:3227 stop:3715 length:489 start_codon:yes stop_codon:yes gene_type:complete
MSNLNNFKKRVNSIVKSATSVRDKIQSELVLSFEQYAEHGNTQFLAILLNAVNGTRTLPMNQVLRYITAHVNVQVKNDKKTNTLTIKKVSKNAAIEYNVPTVNWYEFGNATKVTDFDLQKSLKSVLNNYQNALNNSDRKVVNKHDSDKLAAIIASELANLAA